MGKKTRTGTGRRTILQLSPPGPRSLSAGGNPCREEGPLSGSDDEQDGSTDGPRVHSISKDLAMEMKPPAVKATEGLSLLGAYEDSDDEDGTDSQPAPAKTNHNQSADIDSTLASFLAEIDAITTQPAQPSEDPAADSSAPAPTPPRPDPKDQPQTPKHPGTQNGAEPASEGAEFQYDTQYSLVGVGVEMGDWQEVWDENTGCYYYWNTNTNEVTWQLPHYLAHQVQGLQQYPDSSGVTVNGSSAAPSAAFYPEQNPTISTTVPAAKKEAKRKEVMESVVALTCEEEERRGVAASLLAPLIPAEVKEAEERWRKKALGLAEAEVPDSEGEARPAEEPVPMEPEAPAQADPRSNAQSGESSEAEAAVVEEEEEAEEDTIELELALERKKAELRALEEGDGSVGGSSPCSDASQEGARVALLRKSKWKTTFLRSASPDSNSRGSEKTGRDTPEPPDTVPLPKLIEQPIKEEPVEPEPAAEKTKPKVPTKEEEETAELKFQIGELANTVTSKMEFLGINKKAISNFQLLLLQTETRIADWREGALNGNYLRRRLQEAAEQIKHYELNATPKGWSCHWDREHRRYFYVNDQTSASQWEFPDVDEGKDGDGKDAGAAPLGPEAPDDFKPPPPPEPPAVYTGASGYMGLAPVQSGLASYWTLPQPPLPPPTDPPLPADYPPPPPPPPDSPPPPPPPPLSEDGEIEEVEMEDEEGEPPAPGTEEEAGRKSPPQPAVSSTKVCESAASPGVPVKALKRKAPSSVPGSIPGPGQLHKTVTIGSSPILYSQAVLPTGPVLSAPVYWGVSAVAAPVPAAETTAPPVPALPAQPPIAPAPVSGPADPPPGKVQAAEKTKKLKRDKAKKSKTKMPSLVKKWQSIQRELDEEEKSSSSDEDRDQLNHKRIEEWKQQQLVTGKAGKNANFEALPDDWRQRLKKRKVTPST
ncbi:formin-binding protein 4 isoform X2 [Amia ocellicauda]|uniref:formin-binding protein 4 isoform X2 n=1 Tax=Amia ocellicauda TaxID=2972642 RepID=UPI003463884E